MAERAQGRMAMHPEIHLTLFWPAGHHHPYGTERKPDVQVVGHNAHIYEAPLFLLCVGWRGGATAWDWGRCTEEADCVRGEVD